MRWVGCFDCVCCCGFWYFVILCFGLLLWFVDWWGFGFVIVAISCGLGVLV